MDNFDDMMFDESSDGVVFSPAEIALRNRFVREYVVDYDDYKACLRIGFLKEAAQRWRHTFLNEPYVQRKIKEVELSKANDSDSQKLEDTAIVMTTLREAAQNGPFNTRVSAATTMAKILGMDKTPVDEDEFKGGILLIPTIADTTEWELVAEEQQAKLVKESLNEI
jgi:hypothetical protein